MTPGMSTVPSGIFASFHTAHSCSWRGLDASNENAPARIFIMMSMMCLTSRSCTRGPMLML